ncbi:tetratricopeptide repeat protein [Paraburkholderia susongensis]|uniref:Tetratricopeptide repeat-containing protein n=1 Tax=Paraburkholderia susongensis TaxID=1515439 RepID=A0A1X7IP68_9BURK|nr:tetratricopeptide repeat protein [Paraburkholderia susongensis]SMG16540.1 Tetratricopeptide repeat-containing protein [Paraburkholderia susongensis]
MQPVFDRAFAAHRDGRLDDAERDYRATLEHNPSHVDALHLLGVLRHQQGQHEEAVALVRRAVNLRPEDAALQLNLGNALKALGQIDAAIEQFRNALTLAPTFPMAHYNLGNAYASVGRHEDAADAFERSLRLQPDDVSSHNNLGNALHALGRHEEAITSFRRTLELRPGHAGALNNMGMSLNALDRPHEAVPCFEAALAAEPRFVAAHFNLANTFDATGRHAEAVASFEAVLRLQPNLPPAIYGMGNALAALGRPGQAQPYLERAVGLDPQFALAWLALGAVHQALGAHTAAVRALDQALRLSPDLASAHMNRALAWLAMRDFARGLPEYEWRSQIVAQPVIETLPRWHGEPIEQRTLLVHAEQGLGDTLQFVRFMPLVAQRAARVVLEVQPPLLPLLAPAAQAWRVTLIAQGQPRPAADLQIPLLSLPLALGTSYDTIPGHTPYLSVPPAYGRKWRGSLGGQAKRKIGLAWSGRIQRNETRSMPLAALDPLFALDGIDWIVLQPDLSDEERAALDAHPRAGSIHRLDRRIGDFADTAAIVARLDAVVSIDTSIAHLAGALRKPLWLMLPFAADWRWFDGDTRSPWYPGATLVRQPRPGAWDEVVDVVAKELRNG